MPRYREYCQGRVSVPLTPTVRIEARCLLWEGHEGDCAADMTRVRLRWAGAGEAEGDEEASAEGATGVVACRNGEHA